jgi:hypothetical protein
MTEKKMKLQFAPGCFDNFEGSQEELNELLAEITKAFESGDFLENSQPLDIDALSEEDPELAEELMRQLSNIENMEKNRKLN